LGTTFRFLALGTDADEVLRWFTELPAPPEITRTERGHALYFRSLGRLVFTKEEPQRVDQTKSPVVSVFAPRRRRGVLRTAAEVHFLTTPINRAPKLAELNRSFRNWLRGHELVFSSRASGPGNWDYYLEGSVRNFDGDVFALPVAMEALRRGQYFVADDDSNERVERLCKTLRLRGVEGITASD
jgi:hypothetical protein